MKQCHGNLLEIYENSNFKERKGHVDPTVYFSFGRSVCRLDNYLFTSQRTVSHWLCWHLWSTQKKGRCGHWWDLITVSICQLRIGKVAETSLFCWEVQEQLINLYLRCMPRYRSRNRDWSGPIQEGGWNFRITIKSPYEFVYGPDGRACGNSSDKLL